MMPHGHQQMASKCDSELSLTQERFEYVVVGNPEAVVGTSTAFYNYNLVHERCPEGSAPESPRKALADIQRF